ncbi:MAG TPA: hypothetical protein VF857_09995 [Spirochaetota bacterium]
MIKNIVHMSVVLISVFGFCTFCAAPLFAGEWEYYKTIPSGAISDYTGSGFVNLAGFSDENNGIAICTPKDLLITRDGGTHWELVNPLDVMYFDTFEVFNPEHLWVAGEIDICSSTDSGTTWSQLPKYGSITIPGSHFISFVSPDEGWLGVCDGGSQPTLSHTRDGGKSWVAVQAPKKAEKLLWNMNFVSSDTGFILLFNGEVWQTRNGGISWVKAGTIPSQGKALPTQNYGRPHSAMRFTDPLNGTVIVYFDKPRGFASFSTSDGGHRWTENPLPREATAFHGAIYLSRNGQFVTIGDLESNALVVCRKK